MKVYRQGDCMVIKVEEIPAEAKKLARGPRGVVLMEGEATGHAHRFADRYVHLFETPKKERFLKVVKTSALLHEEHTQHKIPPGLYRIPKQVEYTPEELRRVMD